MDLSEGFQIEEPDVFVPWETPETEFQLGFKRLQLRRVTDGYFTTRCTSLSGLSHDLGFHFYPRHAGNGKLLEFEFFNPSLDLATSYRMFERHLEQTFGLPMTTSLGSEDYSSHTWAFPGVEVVHFVRGRFGPEECVRIRRTGTGRERNCRYQCARDAHNRRSSANSR